MTGPAFCQVAFTVYQYILLYSWLERRALWELSVLPKDPIGTLCTCVLRFGTFLSRPLQNNNVKWPNSRYYGEREHTTMNFLSMSGLELYSLRISSWTVRPHWTNRTCWNNLEIVLYRYVNSVHFLSDIFHGVFPSWLLKVTNDATNTARARAGAGAQTQTFRSGVQRALTIRPPRLTHVLSLLTRGVTSLSFKVPYVQALWAWKCLVTVCLVIQWILHREWNQMEKVRASIVYLSSDQHRIFPYNIATLTSRIRTIIN